jgi:hypothetical protein
MKKVILFMVIAFLLAACGPSDRDIQAAIAKTQLAWLPTPDKNQSTTSEPQVSWTPSPRINPSQTSQPCSAQGWDEIETYLTQYQQALSNLGNAPVSDVYASLDSFNSLKNKVNAVEIQSCAMNARQSIVNGMTNEINAMQIIASGYARIDAAPVFLEGVTMMDEGINELAKLGIQINYK